MQVIFSGILFIMHALNSTNTTVTTSCIGKIILTSTKYKIYFDAYCSMCLVHYFMYIFNTHADKGGDRNKYALLQYMFDGPEVPIKVKPHGNSKSDSPFFTTCKSTKQRLLPALLPSVLCK